MPLVHTHRGAKRAREARARLGLDTSSPVDCLLTLVEHNGMPVVIRALHDDVAGMLYRNAGGVVALVNGAQWIERRRFTLAHEFGHLCIGHDGPPVDRVVTIFGNSHDPREVEANAFAATFLAPADGVRGMVDGTPGLEDVVRIAARFGISTIAALYRLRTLQLVDGERSDRLAGEIADKHHLQVWDLLDLDRMHDRLAELEEGPYLSPALDGSALAAGALDLSC